MMVYGRITKGFSKLDEDLLNDQLNSHLKLHLESDKNNASRNQKVKIELKESFCPSSQLFMSIGQEDILAY